MTTKESNDIIAKAAIRPTSIRILVYKAISELEDTFSLADLEDQLPTIDKSSIFRALTLFHEHHLIHSINDGSGFMKYCLCHNHGSCQKEEVHAHFHCEICNKTLEEVHAHFHCEICNKTFCIDSYTIPDIVTLEAFIIKEVNFVIKGICAKCTSKHK